jgi:hypothetical protein
MATYAYTFNSGDTVTPTRINDARTVSEIVNADVSATAAIAGTKVAPAFGAQDITVSTANRSITNTGNFALAFGTNNTERMRIDASGNVLISRTSTAAGNDGWLFGPAGASRGEFTGGQFLILNRLDVNGTVISFNRSAVEVGTISITASATSYNTSSDYRLKQSVEPLAGGLAKLKSLAPKTFEFKVEPDVKVDGFIAHEVQAVVPQAVTGEKDGEQMQGLDMSKLVPVLVAAVQDLSAKVEALEAAQ